VKESPVGKWFPFEIDWFNRASATWEDSWVAPILRLLCAMWPAGAKMENRDELLARTAKVPLKSWMRIKEETGFFWVVEDGQLVQPFLAAKFGEALAKAAARSEKASKGGQAKQAKARERLAEEIAAAAASSTAPSSAPSTAPSTPEALLEAHTRAYVGSGSLEEGREDLRATPVPKPELVEACFRAYPRTRRGDRASNRTVAIPVDARKRIALFLLERPGYPLLQVFHAIAKTCDIPPGLADFLADPWDAEATLRAAGGAAGPSRPSADLEALKAKEAAEAAAWEDMSAEEQAAALKAAQDKLNRTLGRRTA
jgi:uncharacterized protein YdaU (DUF1376 family)